MNTTVVSKHKNRRGEIVYSYENDCGAIVATRTLLSRSRGAWRARLYTSPDDWQSFYGLSDDIAEKMCLDHASQF